MSDPQPLTPLQQAARALAEAIPADIMSTGRFSELVTAVTDAMASDGQPGFPPPHGAPLWIDPAVFRWRLRQLGSRHPFGQAADATTLAVWRAAIFEVYLLLERLATHPSTQRAEHDNAR